MLGVWWCRRGGRGAASCGRDATAPSRPATRLQPAPAPRPRGRSRAAPHRTNVGAAGLQAGAEHGPIAEIHAPHQAGIVGVGSRRRVAGRRSRAEGRIDAGAAGATAARARVDDRRQLRDRRQPPVAVVVEPSRLCAPVRTHAVADAGRAAVQRREEAREGGPVRRTPTAAPGVGVGDAVDTRAGVVLLFPDEPRLVVGDRAVTVVHEAQGCRRRAGRCAGRRRAARGRGAAGRRGRARAGRRRGRRAQPGGAGPAATLVIRRAGGAVRLAVGVVGSGPGPAGRTHEERQGREHCSKATSR